MDKLCDELISREEPVKWHLPQMQILNELIRGQVVQQDEVGYTDFWL